MSDSVQIDGSRNSENHLIENESAISHRIARHCTINCARDPVFSAEISRTA